MSLLENVTTGSYGVGIGRVWCSQKLVKYVVHLFKRKKLKESYFSSHKLPKQQSTSFWSQEILGVKVMVNIICIIVYSQILGMSWQYIASLHVIPSPCFSKCAVTYNPNYRPMTPVNNINIRY